MRLRSVVFALLTAMAFVAALAGRGIALPSSFMEANGADGNIQHETSPSAFPPYDWANSGAESTATGQCAHPTAPPCVVSRTGTGGVFDGGGYRRKTTPPTPPAP